MTCVVRNFYVQIICVVPAVSGCVGWSVSPLLRPQVLPGCAHLMGLRPTPTTLFTRGGYRSEQGGSENVTSRRVVVC